MNADLPEKAACACRTTQFGSNLVHVAFAGMFFLVTHRSPKGYLQLVIVKATKLATKKQRGNLFSSSFLFIDHVGILSFLKFLWWSFHLFTKSENFNSL